MFYFLENFHFATYANDSAWYNEEKSTGFIVNDLEQWFSITVELM